MKETRGAKYGRFYAGFVNYVLSTIPKVRQETYRLEFLKELGNLSFEGRKKGQPINPGCVHELEDLAGFEIDDPKCLARFVKEGLHLMYQKQTVSRVVDGFFDNLE